MLVQSGTSVLAPYSMSPPWRSLKSEAEEIDAGLAIHFAGSAMQAHSTSRVLRNLALALDRLGYAVSWDSQEDGPQEGCAKYQAALNHLRGEPEGRHVLATWAQNFVGDPWQAAARVQFETSDGYRTHKESALRWYKSAAVNLLISFSEGCRERWLEAGVPAEKLAVIPLGVDGRLFHPEGRQLDPLAKAEWFGARPQSEAPFLFVVAGYLQARKGVTEAVQAFCEAFSDGEDVALIVKSAVEYHGFDQEGAICKVLAEYPVHPPVGQWAAVLSPEDYAAFLRRADCLVNAHRMEGFGFVPLEAMASGCQVIVTNYHGPTQYATAENALLLEPTGEFEAATRYADMAPGIVFCDYSVEELARLMRRAKQRPIAPEAMAATVKQFTWESSARKFVERLEARVGGLRRRGLTGEIIASSKSPRLAQYWAAAGRPYNTYLHRCLNFYGPCDGSGFGVLNVELAKAFAGEGVYFGLRPDRPTVLPPELTNRLRLLPEATFSLISTWEDKQQLVRQACGLPIILSMSEGTRAPEFGVAMANQGYRLLVPNLWNKVAWKLSGCEVPVSVFETCFPRRDQPERKAHQGFTVLSVGEMWERKDPAALVAAFLEAFPVAEFPDCRLLLKTGQFFEAEVPQDERIRVLHGHLSEEELADLYAGADCYLHLACAEGIGLPVLEAMHAGLTVVYPAHTGMLEFADRATGYPLVNLMKIPALSRYGWRYGDWFRADVAEAAAALREVYGKRPEAAQRAEVARVSLSHHYTPLRAARSILSALARYSAETHRRNGRWSLVSIVIILPEEGSTGEELAPTWESVEKWSKGRAYETAMTKGTTAVDLQAAADQTQGDFVLFLRAGVTVEEDFCAAAVGTFDYDIGGVVPGGAREDGRLVWNAELARDCLMVRRDVLRHVAFDPEMTGLELEDLSVQVRVLGFRLVANAAARVNDSREPVATERLCEKWREARWAFALEGQPSYHETRFDCQPLLEKLSFVVVAHNHLDFTRRCLDSIRNTTMHTAHEIVVLDNASEDGTWEWLEAQPDLVTVRSEKNLGCGGGRNEAAKRATGDLLCFLDNDVELLPGWELTFLLPFSREETAFAGPACFEVDQHPTVREGFRRLYGQELYPLADAVSGCVLFIRREAWEQIGEFHAEFLRYHEDGEWGIKAKAAGLVGVGTPDCHIHYTHTTMREHFKEQAARMEADYAEAVAGIAHALAADPLNRWASFSKGSAR